jgi:biotin carboxyl carrier protein
VFDAPISEGGIVGSAIGMAAYGLRPVVEVQFADYFYPASDQIVSEAARLRYRSAGDFTAPLTIRMPCGGGIYGGQTHSQSPEALFTHVCGLRTVMPSNPYDAKGLLIAAIENDDPVIFLEPKRLYNGPFDGHHDQPVVPWSQHPMGEVPEGHYTVPLDTAAVFRPGSAVTVLTYGTMVFVSEAAARRPASTPRSSTCAASGRWTWPPSWPRSRRPAAAWWCTRPPAPAALAPNWWPWCRSTASTTWKRPSSVSPAGTRPTRTRWNGPTSRARRAWPPRSNARWRTEMAAHVIKVPDVGEGIAEVELVAWHVQPGDTVAEDQALADVMTDKASVEIPSPVAGRVLALGGQVGQMLAVGAELIRIETAADERPAAAPLRTRRAARTAHRWRCPRQRPPLQPPPLPRVDRPVIASPRCAAAPGNTAWT